MSQDLFELSKDIDISSGLGGRWYDLNTHLPNRAWFSLFDCSYRLFLAVLGYYWSLCTSPFSFLLFLYRYNKIWNKDSVLMGLLCVVLVLCLPFFFLLRCLYRSVKEAIFPEKNWKNSGAGSIFFIRPDNPLAGLFWDTYVDLSMMLAVFMACGSAQGAVQTSWVDTDTTKNFWRKLFEDNQVRCPRQLAYWDGKSLDKRYDLDCSLVIKIENSYLGIGDAFLMYGKDFNSEEDILELLESKYQGSEALLLEFVVSDPEIGVHSMDILTMKDDQGEVKCIHCLIWCHCTGSSSHSTTGGYIIDIETETCVGTLNWYSPAFTKAPTDYLDNRRKIPGVKLAVQQAIRAHADMPFDWCRMVGWDCMLTDKGEMMFFEGNFAGARLPRRIFLSFSHLFESVTQWMWPFGRLNPFKMF